MEKKGPKVEDYISQYTDVFTGEGKLEELLHLEIDRNVQPVQLPTATSPHCPQRTSKTPTGQIFKYWSDSEGRYTHELDFSTCGHNKEKWQS